MSRLSLVQVAPRSSGSKLRRSLRVKSSTRSEREVGTSKIVAMPSTRQTPIGSIGRRHYLDMYIDRSEMYTSRMNPLSVADARKQFSEVIDRSHTEAVFIERRGQRAAVVISPEQYERMLDALEEVEDAAAFDEAIAEEGPDVPWAQVKADLGWA